MTHVGRAARVVAGVAIWSVAVGALPVLAGDPPVGSADLRPSRSAWDRPFVDDPNRLIVTFRPGMSALARRSSISDSGATRLVDLPGKGAVVLRTPPGEASTVISELRQDPRVLRVSVDHRRYRDANPTTEPYWEELWGLENTGQDLFLGTPGTGGTPDVDIDARQALGITTGNASTVVAVIDDGVDFSHPDLAGTRLDEPG